MILLSVRMKYLKIATAIVLIAVIISLSALAIVSSNSKADEEGSLIANNEQRIAYLNDCGWVVSEEASEISDVIIPSEFNAVYTEYNTLQLEQGYDLSDYRGVTAKKYTYDVINYPDAVENVEASVLIYNDRVIGGDVSSIEVNGFTQGLIQKH